MTTKPILTRAPGNPWFETEDLAGDVSAGRVRVATMVGFSLTGTGTATDGVSWATEPALITDLAFSVTPAAAGLNGGNLFIEVNAAGQSAFSSADGWVQVMPTYHWPAGGVQAYESNVLGKNHVLTVSGTGVARIRVTATHVGGSDVVEVFAGVTVLAAKPTC